MPAVLEVEVLRCGRRERPPLPLPKFILKAGAGGLTLDWNN